MYVTAVRLIGGDNDRSLEGIKSKTLTERTFAGGESKLIIYVFMHVIKVNPTDFCIVMYVYA